ncbi:MAG: 2-amino-4-hydroxy-6-hydroxymethyldihydropteridine diphosphokinase, partial [Deferribacteraceae bacterium]|nr:2-amino-4-hydroxy-6-hydroxymethyldihydropteridine diphosphokinase [Deferribacteraceae bacterium]
DKVSSLYRSKSLLKDNQPDYLNFVCTATTNLEPFELLDYLKHIEVLYGRKNIAERWQERTIDIDIIDYNGEVLNSDRLTLPHREMQNRPFVLLPMRDIVPNYRSPITKFDLQQLCSMLTDMLEIKKEERGDNLWLS